MEMVFKRGIQPTQPPSHLLKLSCLLLWISVQNFQDCTQTYNHHKQATYHAFLLALPVTVSLFRILLHMSCHFSKKQCQRLGYGRKNTLFSEIRSSFPSALH